VGAQRIRQDSITRRRCFVSSALLKLGALLGGGTIAYGCAPREGPISALEQESNDNSGSASSIAGPKPSLGVPSPTGYANGSQAHLDVLQRRRRLWINDDGNDVFADSEPRNAGDARQLFLNARLTQLNLDQDNQIDTLVYETSGGGFGGFFHPNHVADFRNWDTWFCHDEEANRKWCRGSKSDRDLVTRCRKHCAGPNFVHRIALNRDRRDFPGIDPLHEAITYAHGKRDGWPVARPREVFWGIRVNDTHDASGARNADMFLYSAFKREHPEHQFAAKFDSKGHVVEDDSIELVAGQWSSVRFESPAVRRMVTDAVRDVLERYDVDGIQLNFMRHAVFFRRNGLPGEAASVSEVESMSAMMREIRELANTAAERRQRPVMIAILVPDSLAYAQYLGLDLRGWYESGLVDFVIGSDYMQLQRWSASVADISAADKAQRGLKFVAGFTDTRLERIAGGGPLLDLRKTTEALRGRAIEAWAEGVTGIELSNPDYHSSLFRSLYTELGDPLTAATGSSSSGSEFLQFGNFMGRGDNPGHIPDYSKYFSSYYRPAPQPDGLATVAAPDAPWVLLPGQSKRWDFELGKTPHPRASIYLRTEDLTAEQRAGTLEVYISGATQSETRLVCDKYYAATPFELIDPSKFKHENGRSLFTAEGRGAARRADDIYNPRLLRFGLADDASPEQRTAVEQLLRTPTLQVNVVNRSQDPVSLEDVFVQTSASGALSELVRGLHSF
jgi:hypothetical protein